LGRAEDAPSLGINTMNHRYLTPLCIGRLAILIFSVVALLTSSCLGHAQREASAGTDPNLSHPTHVVTVKLNGYTISGLVTLLQDGKTFKYAIALFPGHPGIMRLREENGQPKFELGGNFLVRSRRHWLDEETLVVVVDAPSDQWTTFSHHFRETPRYAADVEALLKEIGRRYSVEDWTFVGTSEGSVSAFHAARMNPQLVRRTILTASLFRPTRNGPGLSAVKLDELSAQLLWVHHEDDPCPYTSYRDAQEFSRRSRKPLLTVRGGGPGRGEACQAFTAHGFVAVERETVMAMRSWVKTGAVPADLGR
jgi:pimeloyl-ACP methyl ester carboxylesterase